WRVLPSPVDVDFDDRNIFQPDLLILPEDSPRPSLEWEIPHPIWVVEVLSPSTARYDEQVKLPRMAEEGVREAWLVAPRAREIEVCDLARGDRRTHAVGDTAASITLEGFRLPLAELFVG
ncbi:MAG: Uma2 family endonuclease, partial [Planctomycetota bacterium]